MLCLAPTSEAGVTAERTRLVFVEGQREASLLLVNQNPYPVLVQAWVDDGALDGEPDTALAPFLPLPPVFRLEPGRQRSLRLLATGQAQARDRESLYWLNIYEIPPQATAEAAGRPRLTVTLRTQMKVLYRPHGLHPHAEDAAAELGFALRDETLRVDNPTPYFVSLAGLALSRPPWRAVGCAWTGRPYGMPGIRNGSRSTGKPCSGSRPPAASRRCRPRN